MINHYAQNGDVLEPLPFMRLGTFLILAYILA